MALNPSELMAGRLSASDSVVQALPLPREHIGRKTVYTALLAVADMAAVALALGLAVVIRLYLLPFIAPAWSAGLPTAFSSHILWVPLAVLACFVYDGIYGVRLPFWRETRRIIKSLTLAFLIVFTVVSLTRASGEVSRTVLVLAWGIALLALPAFRLLARCLLHRSDYWREPVLILGAGNTGKLIARAMAGDHYLGYRVVGFLDDDPVKRARGVEVGSRTYSVLGGFRDAERVIRMTGARRVVIATPGLPGSEVVNLANRLQAMVSSVMVVPDLFGMPVLGVDVDYFFDERILAVSTRNNLAVTSNRIIKRLFDLTAALLLLVPLLPVMAVIAIVIRLDSPGPAVYTGPRIGRRGRLFRCYKFRTMYLDNDRILDEYLAQNPEAREEWERFAKLRGYDPRVTRVGRVLRKFSLDELPQIFNVIKGDMSLVGPRPYLPREQAQMGDKAETILLTPPGITGLWQVSGRNEIEFDGRLNLESWYVRNWSLWLDLTILLRTFGAVLSREGAY